MEDQMNNTIRSIAVSLVSLAGLLLVSGAAWAQATETPITVRFVNSGRDQTLSQ